MKKSYFGDDTDPDALQVCGPSFFGKMNSSQTQPDKYTRALCNVNECMFVGHKYPIEISINFLPPPPSVKTTDHYLNCLMMVMMDVCHLITNLFF